MTGRRDTALVAIAAALAAAPAARAEDVEEVYLTPAEALGAIFKDGERVEQADLVPTPDERARVEARLGARLPEQRILVERGRRADGSVSGFAVVTEEVGKYKPITFVVGVGPDGAVGRVEVMVYRESRGGEVRRRRFLAQLDGKTLADPLRPGKDVINVTGATLSVRAVTRGVRKVLVLLDELLLSERRRGSVDWRRFGPSPAGAGSRGAPGSAGEGPAAPTRTAAPRTGGEHSLLPVRRARYVMGTILDGAACAEEGREAAVATALEAAFEEVARLERSLSRFLGASAVALANREAAARPVPLDGPAFACVAAALDWARRSGGAFDPTRMAGGHRDVELDEAARTVRFRRQGIALDLGGIGKGFALDRAAAVLHAHGVARAALDFGGQVLALDPPPGERGWVVAVRDPACEARAIGVFEVANASISTSGQYERPGHIVEPDAGCAAARSLQATVACRSAAGADALSTAAFVLGPEAGARLVERVPGAAAVLLGTDGAVRIVEAAGAPRFLALRALLTRRCYA